MKNLIIAIILLVAFQSLCTAQERLKGDLNGNGTVDFADFLLFAENFGRTDGTPFDPSKLVDTLIVRDIVTLTIRDTIRIDRPISLPRPSITVKPGDWGTASLSTLKDVFKSTLDVFADRLMYPLDSNITIEHREAGPRILYSRNSNGSYTMWIDSENNRWSQQIYQFAHEYGHILTNYREGSPGSPQQWFEEAISTTASLVSLRTLSIEWRSHNDLRFSHYASSLTNYSNDIINRVNVSVDFAQWYRSNKRILESDLRGRLTRNEQKVVAVSLLDIFEDHPDEVWNAVRYMNRGPIEVNGDFEEYLNDWRKRTPLRWQFIVTILRTVLSKKRIDKKVPFTQIGCQRCSKSLTTQTSETAQWQSQKRYSIGSTFPSLKKSFSSPC